MADPEGDELTLSERKVPPQIRAKVDAVVAAVRRDTDLRPDLPTPQTLFFAKNKSWGVLADKHTFHQDIGSFFLSGENHYDYLNVFVISAKDNEEEANLRLIPYDLLQACLPQFHDVSKRRGAINSTTASSRSWRPACGSPYKPFSAHRQMLGTRAGFFGSRSALRLRMWDAAWRRSRSSPRP